MKHLLFNSFCRKPVLLLGFQLLMACLAAAPLPGSTGISFYLNQAGFNNEGPKLAVLQAGAALPSPTSFTVTDSATGKLAFSGVLQGPQKINDWVPGKWVYQADFSAVKKPGKYRLMITVNSKRYTSPGFTIAGNELTRQMVSAIIHYYNRQRANTAVEWANDEHLKLFGSDKTVDMRGGWCDASGDVSKYFSHLAYANFMSPQQTPLVTWSMVSAAETMPRLLDQWKLRDSLEDEALWGADYMMRALSKEDYFYMIVFSYFNKDPTARRVVGLRANSVTTDEYACAFREGGGMAIAALARISRWKKHGVFTSPQYLD